MIRVTTASYHTPVLLQPAISYLVTSPTGLYVDATIGGGGHAELLLASFPHAQVIGIDADADALEFSRQRLHPYENRLRLFRANFRHVRHLLSQQGISSADGFLFDLGVSSRQLDDPEKGFSYRFDEPLDMRLDESQARSAAEIVNSYSQDELERILRTYGEEPFAHRIAKSIVQARKAKAIGTTGELANIVRSAIRVKNPMKTLSRVFQAIRIEVNDELDSLRQALSDCVEILRPGGRLVVISYHSLEDRIVKHLFHELSSTRIRSAHKLIPDQPVTPRLKVLTKRPVVPDEIEVSANKRARSARLRAAEKL